MVNYYEILRRSRNGQAPLWNDGLDQRKPLSSRIPARSGRLPRSRF